MTIQCVAGLGVAPSLGDYEPPVLLYTTPRYYKYRFIITYCAYIGQSGVDLICIIGYNLGMNELVDLARHQKNIEVLQTLHQLSEAKRAAAPYSFDRLKRSFNVYRFTLKARAMGIKDAAIQHAVSKENMIRLTTRRAT